MCPPSNVESIGCLCSRAAGGEGEEAVKTPGDAEAASGCDADADAGDDDSGSDVNS